MSLNKIERKKENLQGYEFFNKLWTLLVLDDYAGIIFRHNAIV